MSHGRGQGFYTRVGFGFDTSFGGDIAASGNVSDDLGILAKASTERERHFFLVLGNVVLRSWAWDEFGCQKATRGNLMIRNCEHTSAWAWISILV